MDITDINTVMERAIANARKRSRRLGIHATDEAIAMTAMDDPAVRVLRIDNRARELVVGQKIVETTSSILKSLPQRPGESDSKYHARVTKAVVAEFQRDKDRYHRLRRRQRRT
jgi:hypothetical protein